MCWLAKQASAREPPGNGRQKADGAGCKGSTALAQSNPENGSAVFVFVEARMVRARLAQGAKINHRTIHCLAPAPVPECTEVRGSADRVEGERKGELAHARRHR